MVRSQEIFGIVPPMTTPFRLDDTIDEAALRAEARFMVETARVHGLAVTGSTGEGHVLSTDEVRRITAAVVDEVRGRGRRTRSRTTRASRCGPISTTLRSRPGRRGLTCSS
jgi:dihydrodipicolinate synthase/N-acetylneuraminate lyase